MTPADRIVVILAVAILPFLYAAFWSFGGNGDMAKIRVAGGEEILLPLNKDRVFSVHGPLGDSELEIKDGQIRFVSSPCQGKQCVLSGWLHRDGAFAACLPNRVSVFVTGAEETFDSINF